jgi:hypothetical protein
MLTGFQILIFEFRMPPETTENQRKKWKTKENNRKTKENQ